MPSIIDIAAHSAAGRDAKVHREATSRVDKHLPPLTVAAGVLFALLSQESGVIAFKTSGTSGYRAGICPRMKYLSEGGRRFIS